METTNLVGTSLFGHKKMPENQYIATKWFAIWYPLIPLKSYLVMSETLVASSWDYSKSEYRVTEIPLQWTEIAKIYIAEIIFVIIAIIIFKFWKLQTNQEWTSDKTLISIIFFLGSYFALKEMP